MKRIAIAERENKQARLVEAGFGWEGNMWEENRYYQLTEVEIDDIEAATISLYDHLHASVDAVIKSDDEMTRMGIPLAYQRLARTSWEREDPAVALRFDLARDQNGGIKLIEVNGDTPTTLIETAYIQWNWLEDKFPELAALPVPGQFNSLFENLSAAWAKIGQRIPEGDWMAFAAHSDSLEEYATCEFHRDLATQAGIRTGFIDFAPKRSQMMYSPTENVFHEPGGHIINFLYKLYPWEWMWNEEFGVQLAELGSKMGIVEPAWKIVASNKAILAKMFELNPDHPNLVPTYNTEHESLGGKFFEKPIWGREGTGIRFVDGGNVIKTDQQTPDPVSSKVPPVYQAAIDVHRVDGWYTQFGSWVADHKPSGMIMRESETPIITGMSPIVPHLYK